VEPSKPKRHLYPLAAFLGVIAGALTATFGFVPLLMMTALPFEHIHPALPGYEFGMSIGQDVYFVSLSLGILIGAIAVFRSNLKVKVRSFLLGFAISLLGFFALCDVFSVGDMLSTPHK